MTRRRRQYPVLVLGGYGVFGSRICRRLAKDSGIQLIVAGRSKEKAEAFARRLSANNPDATVTGAGIDIAFGLEQALDSYCPKLVIHTCGPFQGQGYDVATLCIEKRIHYLDLSDDREFVTGFDQLNDAATKTRTLAVAGVSSVPGLTSAVIESMRPDFSRMRSIAIGISPGNRAPRGLAVVAAILSYAGRPIPRWQNRTWTEVAGWHDLQRRSISGPAIGSLGDRWFSACDVPDLILYPEQFPELESVTFHAGLELSLLHLGLLGFSVPVRLGLLRTLKPAAPLLHWTAERFEPFGTDRGGMFVEISGDDANGKPHKRTWNLIAGAGDGPWIPAIPTVILAQKLAHGTIRKRGAMPCLNLFTLDDFAAAVTGFDIAFEVV